MDTPLPPPDLRIGARRQDAVFIASSRELARYLIEGCAMGRGSSVLDIGCGAARLLYGITHELGTVERYVGVDVSARCIDWLRSNISLPFAHFQRIDFGNERYNRRGNRCADIDGESYDVIALHSVFTHMRLTDVVTYLDLIAARLAPGGHCYLTAFVEDDVPDETVNPAGYIREWKGPLHCVRFNRSTFESAMRERGLSVKMFDYRTPVKRQSRYIVTTLPGGRRRLE